MEYSERFWSKVAYGGPGCWEWQAARIPKGYGVFSNGLRKLYAHRTAWEIANRQPVPKGLFVLHRCDNPPCVRPSHLFLGTAADNMADAARKLRTTHGDRHPGRKLSSGQVTAIREDSRSGRVVAAAYDVSEATVSLIRHRRTWVHV